MARSYKIHKSYHTSHHNTTKNHPKNSTSLQASSNAPTLSTSRQTTNNLSLSSQPSSTVRDLQQKSRCFGVSLGSYLACEVAHGEVPGSHKPQGKAHLSEPGTHQRTWRVMGRPLREKRRHPDFCCKSHTSVCVTLPPPNTCAIIKLIKKPR